MVFFSVIIPVYNRANLVGKTIDSVLAQEFEDLEIVVVDDGSTDNTLEILANYGNKIKLLQQKNQGPGAARNLGIQSASGEYISFLDSDDFWFSWTLATYRKAIMNYDYPALIAGKQFNFIDEKEIKSIELTATETEYYDDYYASAYQNLWIGTCATAIRKDALHLVGGFCKRNINAEDSDLWLRLGTAKGFVYIESPIMFAYRRHLNSAISNFSKSYEGKKYLISQEKNKQYLGGRSRECERIYILTTHIRSTSFGCLNQGEFSKGWQLYLETIVWHFKLTRLYYLIGFPVILIWKILKAKICHLYQTLFFKTIQ